MTLLVFALILAQLVAGPRGADDNWGTAMTWVLWWPLIPVVFFLVGRFWCAICPFAKITDLVQKVVRVQSAVPGALKRYGVWIVMALFIGITWADHVWGIVESPRGTAVLLFAIAAGAIACGVLWQRRAWCRYVCPLGGMAGNYSRASMLELRSTAEVCKDCDDKSCYKGTEDLAGCPLYEFPRAMDSNANCNLCGACVKACPNGSLRLSVRPPNRELWFVRKPKLDEALLAIVITGLVFVQNVTMLSVWDPITKWIEGVTGTASVYVNFTLIFFLFMIAPVLLLVLAAAAAGRVDGDSVKQNFAKFGYAIIPLAMGAHMGHNLFHLLAEGRAVGYTAMGMLGQTIPKGSTAFVGPATLTVLQLALLLLGAAASLYAVYRIARNNYGSGRTWATFAPYAVLVVTLTTASAWLLRFPMAMRM